MASDSQTGPPPGEQASAGNSPTPTPSHPPKPPEPASDSLKKEKKPITQQDYWRIDLGLKWGQATISLVGFLCVIVALSVNYRALKTNHEALVMSGKSLKANTQLSMTEIVTDFGKVFVDHKELVPYFYRAKEIDKDDTNYSAAYATAVMMLDILDVASVQSDQFRELWKDPDGWEHWVSNSFATIPIVWTVLDESTNDFPGLAPYLTNNVPAGVRR